MGLVAVRDLTVEDFVAAFPMLESAGPSQSGGWTWAAFSLFAGGELVGPRAESTLRGLGKPALQVLQLIGLRGEPIRGARRRDDETVPAMVPSAAAKPIAPAKPPKVTMPARNGYTVAPPATPQPRPGSCVAEGTTGIHPSAVGRPTVAPCASIATRLLSSA